MTFLPKPAADAADEMVDRLLDAIDQEPDELRARLYAAVKAGRHHAYLQDDRSTVVRFDGIADVEYRLVPPTRRLDA